MACKKNKLIAFLIAFSMIYTWGQTAQAQKYAAEFLTMGVGARALSMGSAYVAISDDASAVYWNPAGLAQLQKIEVSFMHASRFSGLIQINFINIVFPDREGNAFGISYFRMGIEDIPQSNRLDQFERPIIEGYLQDVEHAWFFSFSRRLSLQCYVGGNIKALRQTIGKNSSMGFGFDIAALYRFSNSFSLGVNLQDIAGTYLFWNTGHRDVRLPTLSWGVAVTLPVSFLFGQITVTTAQNIRFEGQNRENVFSLGDIAGVDFHFGAEYLFLHTLAFRVGRERENLTAGAGFKTKLFWINYAFVSYDLGNTHRISLRIML